MLALKRKKEQTILIGDVLIKILSGTNVKIGIEAPKHIPIHRGEVVEQIKQQKKGDAA